MQKYFNSVTNSRGDAILGARVAVSSANGSLATIYSDNGVTTQPNPITTDGNGYFAFYAADGRYDLRITAVGIKPVILSDILLEDIGNQLTDFEERVYPGVYVSSPTTRPSGAACVEGDRCTIMVGGVAYEHLRSGGAWVIPNIDATTLALSGGAAMVGGASLRLGDVSALLAVSTQAQATERSYSLASYHPGWVALSEPPVGGGDFDWVATYPKSQHNGGTVIDPAKAFPTWTDDAQVEEWFSPSASGVGCFIRRQATPAIEAQWFGAKADNLADDTRAIKKAGEVVLAARRLTTGQPNLVSDAAPVLLLGRGTYKVKGDRVFGSPLADGEVTTVSPMIYTVRGDGATLIWDVLSADDRLFNFDYTTHKPQLSGFSIFTINSAKTLAVGGDVFHYHAFTSGGKSYADGSGGKLTGITVNFGRFDSFGTRPRHLFASTGKNMSDQTLVEDCDFRYFGNAFYSENSESVNWLFHRCGLFGGGVSASPTVYFDFTEMGDNFNVVNCAISASSGETLLRTRSKTSSGLYTQTGGFNFNFRDNRIEIYGAADTSWLLCDMNFGKLNMSGTNLRTGGGSQNVKTIVSAFGLGNINLDNVTFNPVEFRFPVLTAAALTGNSNACGAFLHNCDIQRTAFDIAYTDGTTIYAIHDAMVADILSRRARFDQCTYANGTSSWSYELIPKGAAGGLTEKSVYTTVFSTAGIALGNTYTLPPYQTVRKVTLSTRGVLPSTYTGFRVYFGDVALGNYFDAPNLRPDTTTKAGIVLFEGLATVYVTDRAKQSITVFALNSGVETGGIASEVRVDFSAMDSSMLGITTTTPVTRISRDINPAYGSTAARPTIGLQIGQGYFDVTLGKLVSWSGSVWKDGAGATV